MIKFEYVGNYYNEFLQFTNFRSIRHDFCSDYIEVEMLRATIHFYNEFATYKEITKLNQSEFLYLEKFKHFESVNIGNELLVIDKNINKESTDNALLLDTLKTLLDKTIILIASKNGKYTQNNIDAEFDLATMTKDVLNLIAFRCFNTIPA